MMSKLKPPKKSLVSHSNDKLKETIKILSPGWVNLFIDFIFPSIHEKRLEKWRDEVYERLLELINAKNLTVEDLSNNDEFITILKQSLLVASRTHQEEKLLFLKNIIVNSIDSDLTTDYKLIFNRLVDELSPTHIKILKHSIDNQDILKETKKYEDYYNLIIKSDQEFKLHREEFTFFISELVSRDLIRISRDVEDFETVRDGGRLRLGGGNSELPLILITEIANKFIKYILIAEN